MGLRITTWNVNGIRNPFSYEPWRGTRTFESMFDILEADIVVIQETKIQRKDLRDDMVLVPGWDCYFSLPKFKKGYSGVVIYTRNSTCAPIRAEEGITGVLCPPGSSTAFRDMPEELQIGGYPTFDKSEGLVAGGQESSSETTDAAILDSEGRCVVLEFPAFVLIGTYCPAYRDESRDSFRMDFLNALDARIRNLVSHGKRVFVTGDINISKAPIDSAHALESIRKGNTTEEEFLSSPPRRLFNALLADGNVAGDGDISGEPPVLHDVCRSFHPDRTGMYTCWDTRLNTRPGNYGSRIDYVLCTLDMQDWFAGSNIQEGLMGSDHCPVYAQFKEQVSDGGVTSHILDIVNPPGTFKNGQRQREYSPENSLSTSGRRLPEFDVSKRQSIKDMFTRKTSTTKFEFPPTIRSHNGNEAASRTFNEPSLSTNSSTSADNNRSGIVSGKRQLPPITLTAKRSKTKPNSNSSAASASVQRTLQGFFKPRGASASGGTALEQPENISSPNPVNSLSTSISLSKCPTENESTAVRDDSEAKEYQPDNQVSHTQELPLELPMKPSPDQPDSEILINHVASSKEDWTKLFTKKPVPRCDGHKEPCISLTTKKAGVNCGRAFWICPRPLGPSGEKEKSSQWRCPTFIWASDWNGSTPSDSY